MSVLSIATGIMKSKLFKFFETRVFNFGMKQPLGKIGGVFQTSLTSHSYAMNFEFFPRLELFNARTLTHNESFKKAWLSIVVGRNSGI